VITYAGAIVDTPSSVRALLGAGLAGIGLIRRRARRQPG
jgi:hypothetical protein